MGVLAFCLDPKNRPENHKKWFEKLFSLTGDQISETFSGPRIDWFALEMQKRCKNFNAELQDKCIRKYMKLY